MKMAEQDLPPEIAAVGLIYTALKDLEPASQIRAIKYAAELLGIQLDNVVETPQRIAQTTTEYPSPLPEPTSPPPANEEDSALDGINAIAIKWIKRNSIDPVKLQDVFSLGIDEIDLVAKSIPGTNKKDKMRNVLLLQAVAEYLGSGTAKVSHEKLKEAWLHYGAYDSSNAAAHLKSWETEVSGSKEAGFTLTSRGLSSATDLVKTITS